MEIKLRFKHSFCFVRVPIGSNHRKRSGLPGFDNIPKYQLAFFSKSLWIPWPRAGLWPGCWLRGRTTHVLHWFAFCLGTFLSKLFPCQNRKGWGKEEKNSKAVRENCSWIRWHEPRLQEIKLNLWKGTAERLVDFKMSCNSCVLVGQQLLSALAAAGSAHVNKADY